MHANAPRMNGGIGFAINGPKIVIKAKADCRISVTDTRISPMVSTELEQLRRTLDAFAEREQFSVGAAIHVSGAMRTHIGMGSATAIRLGALEALSLVNERPLSREALVAASGRGGTSGIGVNTYFAGGLVCDLGRASDGSQFTPSSQARATPPPLTLPAVQMPAWPIVLCIPESIRPKTQEEEITFFTRTTPLPAEASFEASYIAVFEIYAAAIENDFPAFCSGIQRMQDTAWKRAERAEYGNALSTASSALRHAGAQCVGMSSLGPMMFCFADGLYINDVTAAARNLGCDVHLVHPINYGREVRIIHA